PTPAAGSNPLLSAAEVQILAANEQFQAGIANYERSEFREALAFWRVALAGFQAEAVRAAFPQDSLQGEANALGNLGIAYDSLGDYRQAIDFLQQTLEIKRQIGDRRGEANALGNLGNAYHALGDYLQAIDFHQQSLEIAQQIGDRRGEAASLGNLGSAYYSLGDYQKAIDFQQQSLEIARQIGDRLGEAISLGNLGIAYYSLGDYQKAIDFQQQQLEIARQIGYRQGEANALGNLGNAYRSLGDYGQAIDFHQQSLEIARQIGDRRGEASVLGNLGIAYDALGDYGQAIDFYQQSLEIARQIGDRRGEANALGNLGIAYDALGDYERSVDLRQQSLDIAREIGDRQRESQSLNNLGIAYLNLGNYQQAIDFQQQELDIARQIGNRQGEANSLDNLGIAYRTLGDYAQAIGFHQQSLEIAQQIGDRLGEARSLGNLGIAYSSLNDYERAIDFHQQQLAINRQIGDRQGEAAALSSLGLAHDASGDHERAIDFHQQALEIARQIGDRLGESLSLHSIGLAFWGLENLAEAERYFKLSTQSQEFLHFGRSVDFSRLSLLDSQQQTYRIWQMQPVAEDQSTLALEATERGRNSALIASIEFHQQYLISFRRIGDRRGEGIALYNLGLAFWVLKDLAEAERYFQLSAQVQESLHSTNLSDIQRLALLDSQQQTYRFWQVALIAQDKPEAALEVAERSRAQALALSMSRSLKDVPSPPNLERIQAIATTQNATLVEYSVLPSGRILIWVIQPNGTLYWSESDAAALDESLIEAAGVFAGLGQNGRGGEPPETPLSDLVQDTQAALTVRGGEDGAAVAPLDRKQLDRNLQVLHALLIEPIAQWLPEDERQQVIFIPHQELFRVPFAALQDDDGAYLIEKHTILTAPSIQSLELARQHQERIQTVNATEALIVGNPTLPETLVAAYGWQALPGAEREARKVGSYLSEYLGTAPTVLLLDQATERQVRERLHTARFIHLATHGTLAAEPTDLPGLRYSSIPGVLALAESDYPESDQIESDQSDGSLTADELLEMTIDNPLNAELVVLSACQTGQGPITSDGVYGLSRVLLTAGVPTLVVSLWNASDYHTVWLMDEFYRQFLEEGQDKAQALRQALLQMINEGDNNPQYWAAFTLMGVAE
ncbi:MAG: CHAT domain-containing protein, partial [Leptolyngbya sp. SIO4C5]|nr:CHAT domain-containing protein [Leptolyngbya sp. SIO4C5]